MLPTDAHTYVSVSGGKNVSFSGNFAYILNEWSPIYLGKKIANLFGVSTGFLDELDGLSPFVILDKSINDFTISFGIFFLSIFSIFTTDWLTWLYYVGCYLSEQIKIKSKKLWRGTKLPESEVSKNTSFLMTELTLI